MRAKASSPRSTPKLIVEVVRRVEAMAHDRSPTTTTPDVVDVRIRTIVPRQRSASMDLANTVPRAETEALG